MNRVSLVGRITKDPELRYTKKNIAVANFSIAINRVKEGTDFIPIKIFNKQAENVKKYCTKGKLVAVEGRIQTGSYEKEGKKYYTTEIMANNVEFLSNNINTQEYDFQNEKVPEIEPGKVSDIFEQFGNLINDEDSPY